MVCVINYFGDIRITRVSQADRGPVKKPWNTAQLARELSVITPNCWCERFPGLDWVSVGLFSSFGYFLIYPKVLILRLFRIGYCS